MRSRDDFTVVIFSGSGNWSPQRGTDALILLKYVYEDPASQKDKCDVILTSGLDLSLSLSPSLSLDIIQTHYQPWGFLRAAHTVCPGLFEELLLLLQPLALLPFSLDLLFQHRLLQSGRQQRQHKELLRVSQDLLLSAHSTLQLARSRGQEGPGDMDLSLIHI